MKKLTKALLILGFASALGATTAIGQLVATFDENGNGVVRGGGPLGFPDPYPVPYGVGADPGTGTPGLFYVLPGAVVLGDVELIEPGQPAYSDVIRFTRNTAGQSVMFFFSEFESGELNPDLADMGLPPLGSSPGPIVVLDETGLGGAPYLEGANGATYTPLPGQPGYAALPLPLTYNFISDSIPEPNSLALLGVAGGLLALVARWRSARV